MPDSFNFGFNQDSFDHDSSNPDSLFDPDAVAEDAVSEDAVIEQREIASPKLNLNRTPGEPPLMVDMQAFFEFTFWMAEELLDLEAQYRQPVRSRDRGIGGGRLAPLD